MFTITIVPLCAPDAMTVAAAHALRDADKLFLQTSEHPAAKTVLALGKPFTSMDDLYAGSEDFDALNESVAQRLVNAGTCVYAVTGNIADSQLPAITALVKARGGKVTVLPGLSLSAAAFCELPAARVVTASAMPDWFDVSQPVAVEELDDAIRAGNAKLALSEFFPDDWPILLSELCDDGRFTRKEIPLYELDRQKRYGAATVAYVPSAPFDSLTRYGYEELTGVIKRLRAPDGCPWDREQTHETLREPLLEECYELLDAIESGDDAHICEELGDVLLQVVLHAEIAAEQGRFTQRDVNSELVKKLVYRHPHIFGGAKADTADEVLVNWDKLKKAEKSQKTQTDVLKSVPRNLPSLTFSYKIQKKAANVGFDWSDAESAFPKISEESGELMRAMHGVGDVTEELGDLLFSVVNVARLLHINPELALRGAADKFTGRFAAMEQLAVASGRNLEEMSLKEMDLLWNTAKLPKESGII